MSGIRVRRALTPVLAIPLLIMFPSPVPADEVFPIGLFEAGSFGGNNGGVTQTYNDPSRTSLDEVKYPDGFDSGVNIVFDGQHQSLFDNVSVAETIKFVNQAGRLGLRVLLGIPAQVNTISGEYPYDQYAANCSAAGCDGPHLLQRPLSAGQRCDYASTLINAVKADTAYDAVYGYYIADEPGTVGVQDTGVHLGFVSALNLQGSYEYLVDSVDAGRPYVISMPDYGLLDQYGGGYLKWPACWRAFHDYDWRWNNDAGHDTVGYLVDPWSDETSQVDLGGCRIQLGDHSASSRNYDTVYHSSHTSLHVDQAATQNYNDAADIIQNDTYVADSDTTFVRYLRQMDDLVQGKPDGAHMIISIDNARDKAGSADTCECLPGRNCNTKEQIEFQAFTSIIHGARGIWFWSYQTLFNDCDENAADSPFPTYRWTHVPQRYIDDVVPTTRKLAAIERALAGSTLGLSSWGGAQTGSVPDIVNDSGHVIHCSIRRADDDAVLIAANMSSVPRANVGFDLDGLDPGADADFLRDFPVVEVLHEDRVEVLSDGVLTDSFDPYSVHVYRFRRLNVPGDFAVEDAQEAIDEANPGNVVRLVGAVGREFPPLHVEAGVRVESANGAVIDADGADVGVHFAPLDKPGTELRGITVRNHEYCGVLIDSGGAYVGVVDHCRVEGGDNGIAVLDASSSYMEGASATIRNCEVVDAIQAGILINSYVPGGVTVTVTGNELVTTLNGSNVGISNDRAPTSGGGGYWIENNSVRGWYIGIESSAGQVYLNRNLVTECDSGIECSSGNTLSHNNSWHNGTGSPFTSNYGSCGGTLPTGNLSSDPKLCSSTEFGVDITSPCTPAGNAWAEWIGARRIACASGHVTANTSIATSDVEGSGIALRSDLQVDSGKTLTVGAGVRFLSDDSDEANIGYSADKNEIIANGRVIVNGTATARVVFRSSESSPAAGDWAGFYVKNGGDLKLTYADVSHCVVGAAGVGLADTMLFANTTIDSCSERIIQINNRCGVTLPETCVATRLLINGGTFTMNAATTAILTKFPQGVSIDGLTIHGSSAGYYGVYVDTMGSGNADVRNCVIDGLSNGTGIYVFDGSPVLSSNQVTNSKWGIQLCGTGTPQIARAATPGPGTRLNSCTTGLHIQSTSAQIDSVSVDVGSVSSAICVTNSGNSSGTYTKLKLNGGTVGISATSTASTPPTLRNSRIQNFTVNGSKTNATAGVNLGNAGSPGNNWIESGVASGKWVSVKTCVSGGPLFPARGNYWGGPPQATNYSTCVDTAGSLGTQPSGAHAETEPVPRVTPQLTAQPNPFSGEIRFHLASGAIESEAVRLTIFDLAGRVVREVWNGPIPSGDHELGWDGVDARGRTVGAGIYFARFSTAAGSRTLKLVKLR